MSTSYINKKIIIKDLHRQHQKNGKITDCGPVVIEWDNTGDNKKIPSEVLQICLKKWWLSTDDTITISRSEFRKACIIPYLTGLWLDPSSLLRTPENINETAVDNLVLPQLENWEGWILYYPREQKFIPDIIKKKCASAQTLSIEPLPSEKPPFDSDEGKKLYNNQGLLFLPNEYIAMGGVFTDMYGWGAYFIIQGLLNTAVYIYKNPQASIYIAGVKRKVTTEDAIHLFKIAKGMVDNHIYQINFYGGFVLNSNRTYLMTRSQPPLFTREALAVYEFQKEYGEKLQLDYYETLDKYLRVKNANFKTPESYDEWLKREVLPAAVDYYNYWTNPRFDPASWSFKENAKSFNPRIATVIDEEEDKKFTAYRYYPDGKGPILESVRCVMPKNNQLYPDAALFFSENPDKNPINPKSGLHLFWDPECNNYYNLTEDFYAADRAMRESGFDLSGRYGEVGQYSTCYAPVCLNSLLLQMGKDIVFIQENIEGETSSQVTERLLNRVILNNSRIAELINSMMWTDKSGYYSDLRVEDDYNLPRHTYEYATSFYPLWAGAVADNERQVQLLTSELLKNRINGVATSLKQTGNNCDYPYVRAPIQSFLVEALHNVEGDLQKEAQKIAMDIQEKFINIIDTTFATHGVLLDFYNCEDPTLAYSVERGYGQNQSNYGWTNGVYMHFLNNISEKSPSTE
ncbi:MAG: hypothetical protein GY750_05755 [Lentisphaerae bacterium]|nr:hypothetical protein [Lentisphaerota bacterium]MCP4100914.1 hypothetical protein [Lentisphaerota bacterium]